MAIPLPDFRARAVVYTINNPTDEDRAHFKAIHLQGLTGPEIPGLKFLTAYPEEGIQEGTPHLQGYAYAFIPQRRSWWTKLLGPRAWFEAAKGTPAQNLAYVKKQQAQEHPWAYYEITDLEAAQDELTAATDAIAAPVVPPPLRRLDALRPSAPLTIPPCFLPLARSTWAYFPQTATVGDQSPITTEPAESPRTDDFHFFPIPTDYGHPVPDEWSHDPASYEAAMQMWDEEAFVPKF